MSVMACVFVGSIEGVGAYGACLTDSPWRPGLSFC